MEKQKNKYTFIIPVYNVEKYLPECLNSILVQSFTYYNIILVDDGSKDGSGNICDVYSKKYDNISVIHKKNGGLSSARNEGLKKSETEFVVFLDSDDYWADSDALNKIDKLTLEHEDVDIISFASFNFYEKENIYKKDRYYYPLELNTYDIIDCLKYLITHDLFNLSATKKVFRRSFLIKNELYFKDGIKSEDVDQGIRATICLPKICFLNEKIYVYRHREGSITTTIDLNHIKDLIDIIKSYIDPRIYADSQDIYEYIMSYLAYQYALTLTHLTLIKDKGKKKYYNELKQLKWLLKYDKYPRTKKIYRAYKIFGLGLLKYLLVVRLKMKRLF